MREAMAISNIVGFCKAFDAKILVEESKTFLHDSNKNDVYGNSNNNNTISTSDIMNEDLKDSSRHISKKLYML